MRPLTARQRVTYLIQQGDYGPVKIGSTAGDPYARMATLQTGNPQTLELIWIFPYDIEAILHEEFDLYRLSGEWFEPCVLDTLRAADVAIP